MAKALLTIGLVCLFVYFYVRYLERQSIYYPTRAIEMTPDIAGLDYEDVYFYAEDNVKLQGWLIPNKNARFTLIFCHGNGGNMSHRLDKILFFHGLYLNIFIFDYRGYGQSEGQPSEAGLYRDIQAAYDYVVLRNAKLPNKPGIIVYGESLGGAVAVDLATREKIDGLILEGTFTSTEDMAKIVYPFLPGFLIQSKFDTNSKMTNLNLPKLCMQSRHEAVPWLLSPQLYCQCSLTVRHTR